MTTRWQALRRLTDSFSTLYILLVDAVCYIPLTENHLRRVLHLWAHHYNAGRPHMSLGPGMPQPSASLPAALCEHRHRLPYQSHVVACPILGGLHHDYRLAQQAS